MSTGNARSALLLNERGGDVHWYKDAQQIFQPRAWTKVANHTTEMIELSPNSSSFSYGSSSTVVFEVDRRGDFLGSTGDDFELIVTRGALSATGDTYVRFNDWEGYAMIDTIRYIYVNREVKRIRGEDLYNEIQLTKTQEQRSGIAALVNGDKGAAERDTLATASSTLHIPILFPWRKLKKGINMFALPNKLRIEVTFKSLASITQTDGTSPACTISDVKLRSYWLHLKEVDRKAVWLMTRTKLGYSLKVTDYEEHIDETIASGTTTWTLKLKNFKNACINLIGWLRTSAQIDNTDASRDLFNYVAPPDFYLRDSGNRVTDIIEAPWSLYRYNHDMYPKSQAGLPFLLYSFCPKQYVEASEDDCYGSRNLGKYHNLELYLDFGSATSVEHKLTIKSRIHNLNTHVMGDFRRYILN